MNLNISFTNLQANNFLKVLLVIDLSFAFLYGILHILASDWPLGQIHNLFNLDGETTLPAWFSSMQLFLAGIFLFAIGRMQSKDSKLPSSFFYFLSVLFVFLSADEGAAIHEKISALARRLELSWMLFNGKNGAWIMVYGLIGMIILGFIFPYFRIAWKYHPTASKLAVLSGFIFLTGAVGFELLSYFYLRDGANPLFYKLEVMFEEFFEMSGISIFIRALLFIKQTSPYKQQNHLSKLENKLV